MASSPTGEPESKELRTNPRGIPHAPFVSDIEQHIGGPEAESESALRQFQEAIAKYRYMELNLNQRKSGLEEKIPDIKKSLSVVEHLIAQRKPTKGEDDDDLEDDEEDDEVDKKRITTFELNDTLYAQAEIEETDTVYLWLGANVMLAYKLPEARELLASKLSSAQQNLSNVIEDLEFLREQITIMEVNTARVYNWDVRRRRLKREAEAVGNAAPDPE
ncbi:prefoldin subunit 3, putative [Rhizoctonia solani AG-3 Rhs1AP]|uniref:Prefoldin subunit 3 n=3 Tax=Rhizoctonia solani TaxID=456999 RepID=A0A074RTK9_9AGAM|nr:prefoldin subunit 3, putative [Rhizoctonia solani AG-3 Rhs1AP]KEP48008.1 putative prefoldin subunit 3 [Rhizoctonia solani 123E]